MNIIQMGTITVISTFPSSFLHGFLFNLAFSLARLSQDEERNTVGQVYFYEMLGTAVGGASLTYFFIPNFDVYWIANLVGFVSNTSILLTYASRKKSSLLLCAFFSGLFLFLLVSGANKKLVQFSLKRIWGEKEIIFSENSMYQNLTVIKNDSEYTVYTDGLPYTTVPNPDTFYIEEVAHLPLLFHPMPKQVLLLSVPPEVAKEVIKYPSIERIDYVEMDPRLLQIVEAVSKKGEEERKVKIYFEDGRHFVKKAKHKYDVIILGIKSPNTLQTNRFFTFEFFEDVKNILNEGGLYFFSLPGSNYYTQELRMLNTSVFIAAKETFNFVYVLPGSPNFFILTDSRVDMSADILYEKLSNHGVSANLISKAHLDYKLDNRKREWFLMQLEEKTERKNTDFTPFAFFFSIAYENLKISPVTLSFFRNIYNLKIEHLFLLVLFTLLLLVLVGAKKGRSVTLTFSVFTTGLTMTMTEVIFLFAYQTIYGYVLYALGILLSAFMTGCAGGSIAGARIEKRFRSFEGLVVFEIAATIFLLVILFNATIFKEMDPQSIKLHTLFLALLFISGFFIGAEFTLGVSSYLDVNRVDQRKGIGVIFASDLIGGFFGALAGSFIIFPILGLKETLVIIFVLKLSSLSLFLLIPKK
ncbi:MAG: hypothetical protein N2513_06655 [Deltaproteobacteria bacterium]|nr:hypothetical protein [Deltaproteobacteria bacterium]